MPDDGTGGDEWAVARITDERLALARSKIGKVRREAGWNSVVTRDTIRRFALGVGDDNPLFRDEDYAAKSPGGQLRRSIPLNCFEVKHPLHL